MAKTRAAALREVLMRGGRGAFGLSAVVASILCAGESGCNGPPATATAYVLTYAVCSGGGQQTVTQIGGGTNGSSPLPLTIPDGTLINDHPVQVQCTVSGNGQYNISLYAKDVNGVTTITGAATADGSTSLNGTFVQSGNSTGSTYEGSNCSLSFTNFSGEPMPPNASDAIQSGLIWGQVSCPNALVAGMAQPEPDGGVGAATCALTSTFLFENCGQ
jgi:hypothetical protein